MAPRPQILTTIVTTAPAFPLVMAANLPAFAVRGQPLVGKVIGVNGAGGYSYAKTAGPAFFTVNSATGDCTGTVPSGQASFDVTISVTDALAATASHTYHITTGYTIEPPGGWTTSNTKTPNAITGQPYQFDVSKLLVSPVLPVTYSISTGSAPTGISFPTSTNPILTATSVSGSTQSFSVTATDSASNVTVIPLTITVGPALSLAITTMPQAVIGQPYYAKVTASGGDGRYSYDISPLNAPLPSWATLNQKTGEITGTPDAISPTTGALNIRFRVTDGGAVSTSVVNKIVVGSIIPPAPKGLFVTTDINGAPISVDFLASFFGDGSDGNVTLDGTNTCPGTSLSAGVYTATRDLFLNNLTCVTGGKLVMGQSTLYVAGVLDISAAPANAITASATANSITAGAFGTDGAVGPSGGVGNGQAGIAAQSLASGIGGGNGSAVSGKGGNGTGGTGGVAANSGSTSIRAYQRTVVARWTQASTAYPFTPLSIGGGSGGASGGSGAGNGALAGGNSGFGGGAGGLLRILAHTINRGASTPQSCISAVGSDGANGVAGGGTGRGGGGGGCGGSGGAIWLCYSDLTGTAPAALWLDASAGKGGNGGASGGGTGTAGDGGASGEAGSITLVDLGTPQSGVTLVSGTNANSGATGGAAKINRITL